MSFTQLLAQNFATGAGEALQRLSAHLAQDLNLSVEEVNASINRFGKTAPAKAALPASESSSDTHPCQYVFRQGPQNGTVCKRPSSQQIDGLWICGTDEDGVATGHLKTVATLKRKGMSILPESEPSKEAPKPEPPKEVEDKPEPPKAKAKPRAKAKAAAKVVEPDPESDADQASEPEPEPAPVAKPRAKAAAKAKAAKVVEPEPEPEPAPKARAKPAAKAAAKPAAKAATKPAEKASELVKAIVPKRETIQLHQVGNYMIDNRTRIAFDNENFAIGWLDNDKKTVHPLTDQQIRFLESHNLDIRETGVEDDDGEDAEDADADDVDVDAEDAEDDEDDELEYDE